MSKISPLKEDEIFEPWDPKYKCCCSSVHVKQGSFIVSVVGSTLAIYFIFIIAANWDVTNEVNAVQIGFLFLDLIAFMFLMIGVIKSNFKFLAVYLIFSVCFVFLLFCVFVGNLMWPFDVPKWLILWFFEKEDTKQLTKNEKQASHVVSIFVNFTCLLSWITSIWWISIVYKYYCFLRICHHLKSYIEEKERRSCQYPSQSERRALQSPSPSLN